MKYDLGLDLGVNSIGWSAVLLDRGENPCGLLDAGVRIFEPGMELDDNHVKADSRAAERRAKRMLRRQLNRRRRRLARVRHLLQGASLLPPEQDFAGEIVEFDRCCRARLKAAGVGDDLSRDHLLPYLLRSLALDEALPAYELGRALYHLAQRRGFLSNRREGKKDDDAGVVKDGIKELRAQMAQNKARTLGEYFASCNPASEKVRRLYTARDLFVQEFELICKRQQEHISPELYQQLKRAIFYQRPLKSAAGLVGECELIPKARRAGWNRPEAQEFRVLQAVNHLVLRDEDLSERKLSESERQTLVDALSHQREMTFTAIRKLLKLPRKSCFTIEDGKEKKLVGDKIGARLNAIPGDFWAKASAETRENILQDLRSYTLEKPLAKRLISAYGLSPEEAEKLSEYTLPEGYCSLSLNALRQLLPHLRAGKSYGEAVQTVFPETFRNSGRALTQLPWPPGVDLRNPLVSRILYEARKVINAVIKEYGKPERIRVELAREAKHSEKERLRISQRNREQEKRRELARRGLERAGIANPRASDLEKYLLAEECHWLCPYTGRTIGAGALFGSAPEFDIEHIIPYSRCMDNSFANKTLCYHEENRSVKKNLTPFEAYHHDGEKYERILERVARLGGDQALVAEKLRRFKLKDTSELADFSNRMLNDTRYASKLVARYVGLLYGGSVDADGKRRVETGTGRLTGLIRGALDFNAFLNAGSRKERNDHRHHAVDAIAIALISPALVKHVADYFNDSDGVFKNLRFWDNLRRAVELKSWPGYDPEIRAKLESMLVSHHTRNRVRGPLHNETIYGKEHDGKRYQRKLLESLTAKEVAEIVDHAVRRAVEGKLAELGTTDPSVFRNENHLPRLKNGHPIKKTKIKITKNAVQVGQADSARFVDPANNHHMVIVDLIDEAGGIVGQEGYVVTLLEAKERLRTGQALIRRDYPDLEKRGQVLRQRYRMVLMKGDIIYTRGEKDGSEGYRVLRVIVQSTQMFYVSLNDARMKKEIMQAGQWYSAMPSTLIAKMGGKYLIDPLGRPRRNNA